MPSVMVSCGEASGDLYAGALALELERLAPGTRVYGLGGGRLHAAGAELIADYRGLAVTGLTEALRVLPRSFRLLRDLGARMRTDRPDVLVAIDFPDFNFRLAAAARSIGIPVVYYVSPQLWAWRPGRMRTLKKIASKMLVIFPFEAALYEREGMPVEFVGHPLIDLIDITEPRDRFLRGRDLDPAAPTVALLPGSRPNEIQAILPGLAASAARIRQAVPRVQFVLARAPGLADKLFHGLTVIAGPVAIVEGRTDDVLNAADVVLTASGTATVQTALHERPMVIVYKLSPLTYVLGRPFVKLDTFGMANLVAGRRVVPELIQGDFTPERVAAEAIPLLTDPAKASAVRAALREVRAKLGEPGASRRAAEAVLSVARQGTKNEGRRTKNEGRRT
jgi:lipid-A-disaccharide synthase